MAGKHKRYSPALGKAICELLADGLTVPEVAKLPDMPRASTIYAWAHDIDHEFSALYARARELGWTRMADDLLRIADDNSNDTSEDDEGNVIVNHDVIARARLRVDTRKWLLSKCLPKIYGDKSSPLIESSGSITVQIVKFTEAPVDGGKLITADQGSR